MVQNGRIRVQVRRLGNLAVQSPADVGLSRRTLPAIIPDSPGKG